MKEELEKQLAEKYPDLYAQYGGDERRTCMHYGFTCGNGWYDILERLSEKLKDFPIEAAQVKEKFGGLRFYFDSKEGLTKEQAEEVWKIIGGAEAEAAETCEDCGKPAKLRSIEYWLTTLCDECVEAAKKRRQERLQDFEREIKVVTYEPKEDEDGEDDE